MLTKDEFSEAQQRLVSAWHKGDLARALAEIDSVLLEGTTEMKGQCLLYRGMINESQSSLDLAKRDWLEALQYGKEGTFLRYELEHNLGKACEGSGAVQEALSWYRTALKTCSTGKEFSGNRTLTAFMRLSGANVSPDDYALLALVIQKSWAVLEIPGRPDLADLAASVNELMTRFNKTINEATEEV